MLSFNNLGKNGRLGNQMFQYAALKGIARKNNYIFSIPYSTGVDEWNDHRLFSIFNMFGTHVGTHNNPVLQERQFHFDQELFDTCPDDVDLFGYFQSYKYFDHIRDEILEDFTFKVIPEPDYSDYVTIHVRRGDYVAQPNFHPVCGESYYKEAMNIFSGEKFLVLSDDPSWCAEQEVFNGCLISTGNSQTHDLYFMSTAKGNIIANSSFSWWGAYLNDKPVVCPERWFGESYNHYNLDDLRPRSWMKI